MDNSRLSLRLILTAARIPAQAPMLCLPMWRQYVRYQSDRRRCAVDSPVDPCNPHVRLFVDIPQPDNSFTSAGYFEMHCCFILISRPRVDTMRRREHVSTACFCLLSIPFRRVDCTTELGARSQRHAEAEFVALVAKGKTTIHNFVLATWH